MSTDFPFQFDKFLFFIALTAHDTDNIEQKTEGNITKFSETNESILIIKNLRRVLAISNDV